MRHDNRDSHPALPVAQQPQEAPPSYPAGSYPAIDPAQPYGAYAMPQPQPLPPTPSPHYVMPHAPIPHTPTPPPLPFTPTPMPFTPLPIDPRMAQQVIDPKWQPQQPQQQYPQARGLQYDMAGSQSRDVMVRRVVWTIALLLGVILVLVVASRL